MTKEKLNKFFYDKIISVDCKNIEEWSPTTNISQAFKCVEYFFTHSDNSRQDIHIEHLDNEWSVSCCYEVGEWTSWDTSDNLPLLICRSLYKALK